MIFCFFCSCIEPGRDGVGDYTRKLAGELIRQGHQASIIALHDAFATSFIEECQIDEHTQINVVRIPKSDLYLNYEQNLSKYLQTTQPDVLSLQFVPYGFNDKGLPYKLAKFLKSLSSTSKWHIMFHELWVGMESTASIKHKIYCLLQKRLIDKLILALNPIRIDTSIEVYKYQIEKLGYEAHILPLISNISAYSNEKFDFVANGKIRIGVFGTIYPHGKLDLFLEQILAIYEPKDVEFLFIGKNGSELPIWEETLKFHNINFHSTGFLSEIEISQKIRSCNYGLSTTSYLLAGKSGTIATFRDNNIPVLCIGKDWEIRGKKEFPKLVGVIELSKEKFDFFNHMNFKRLDISQKSIAYKFASNLKYVPYNNSN